MNEYWVYENWTVRPQKAVIHYGDCRHCNHGKGQHGVTSEEHGCWHGAYNSIDAANTAAAQTGKPMRRCGTCQPT